MTKDTFNSLSICEQFEYLNNQLSINKQTTRASIFKEIGIAKTTVGDRAKSNGYIFNSEKNMYEFSTNETINNTNSTQNTIKKNEAKNNTLTSEQKTQRDSSTNIRLNKDFVSLPQQEELNYLLENIDKIKTFIDKDTHCDDTSLKEPLKDSLIDDIYTFKKEPREYKVKSLRIDSNILQDFESIASTLSIRGVRQQELLSYILRNFIDSYNL